MATGNVTVRLNLNAAGYSAAVSQAQRQMKALQTATTAMGHGSRSSAMEASAAIRVMEGNITNNIRAAERFVATIPGMAKVLHAAFPLVGAVALVGVFGEMTKRAVEFVQKLQQAPQVISNSFREMNLSAETTIDTLNLSTAKMQEQIDLLSGKRPNTLAEDLAEASLAADKLATSLDNDNRKIAEMLKANGLSFLAGFLGKAGTADVTGSLTYFDQHISDLGAQHQHAVRTGDTAGAADLQKKLDDMRIAALNYANSQIVQRQQGQGPGSLNQDANLAVLTGAKNTWIDQQDQEKAEANNKATAPRLKQLEDAKKYADLVKQQQEKIVKQWQQALDQDQANATVSVDQEAAYWLYRAQTATKGSLSYIEALNEANKDIAKINADTMRQQKEIQTRSQEFDALTTASYRPDSMDLSRGDLGAEKEQGRSAADWLKNMREGTDLQRQNAAAWAEASLQMDVAAGRMDTLDAAQLRAKQHTEEYADSLKRLQDALAAADNLPDGFDKKSIISGLKDQATQLSGQRQIQSAQDQQAIASQQLGSGLGQTLAVMAQQWSDMTKQIETVMVRAADSLNDSIARAATGQKGGFGKAFQGIGESLVKSSVQGIEGYALKALHLGGKGGPKPDGTESNRIYVSALIEGMSSMAGAAAGNVPLPPGIVGSQLGRIPGFNGSVVSDFIRPFMGGNPTVAGSSDAQAAAAAQSGGGSIFSKLLGAFLPGLHFGGGSTTPPTDDWGMPSGFQGGFSSGGDVLANRPALIGESGPEMFVPRTAGRIVPNDQLGGGPGGDTHIHVDARGSSDPEAIAAAVHRAAPAIISASVQAQHQRAKRTPQGR